MSEYTVKSNVRGGWKVTKAGNERVLADADTQAEVYEKARGFAPVKRMPTLTTAQLRLLAAGESRSKFRRPAGFVILG